MCVYYLTHGFIPSTRALSFLSRTIKLVTCGSELANLRFELVTRGCELITHGLKLVTRKFDLVTHKSKIVSRISELGGRNF